MSYLFPEGSATERGVVEVGSNINVIDGIISIPQSVDPTADITFDDVTATGNVAVDGFIEALGSITTAGDVSAAAVYDNQNRVVTSVAPIAGAGISITALADTGPDTSFTVNNTGVVSLIAGAGITLSDTTGNITVSATGADFLNTNGVTDNYTATDTDEYIGVNSSTLVTVTLPVGVDGRQYIIKEERGSSTGKVKVQGTGAETLDGNPFRQLTANASLTVVFRAGTWRII